MFCMILLYADSINVDLKWLIKTQSITLSSDVLSTPSGPMTLIYSSNTSVVGVTKKNILLIFEIVWMGKRKQRIPL